MDGVCSMTLSESEAQKKLKMGCGGYIYLRWLSPKILFMLGEKTAKWSQLSFYELTKLSRSVKLPHFKREGDNTYVCM